MDYDNYCGDKNVSPLQAKQMTLMLLQRVGLVSSMVPGQILFEESVNLLVLGV
jgi:hypothetical protein